jgi:hypothetical protein
MPVTVNDPFGSVPTMEEALTRLERGAQQYGVSQSLQEANKLVNGIKTSGAKENEKRAQLNQVAQHLVMDMTARGANASQVANTFQALKPQMPASADQAILMGMLNGDQQMVAVGQKAGAMAMQDNLLLEEAKTKRIMQLEAMKEAAKSQGAQKTEDVAFGVNTGVAQRNLSKLEALVNKYGNYESNNTFSIFSNPKVAGELSNLAYETAIAYAKIVDPASVAREGEVKAAEKYALPMGMFTDSKSTLAAINQMRKSIAIRAASRNIEKSAKANGVVVPKDLSSYMVE